MSDVHLCYGLQDNSFYKIGVKLLVSRVDITLDKLYSVVLQCMWWDLGQQLHNVSVNSCKQFDTGKMVRLMSERESHHSAWRGSLPSPPLGAWWRSSTSCGRPTVAPTSPSCVSAHAWSTCLSFFVCGLKSFSANWCPSSSEVFRQDFSPLRLKLGLEEDNEPQQTTVVATRVCHDRNIK